jgi:uncharacterized protein (TIGR03067 family)
MRTFALMVAMLAVTGLTHAKSDDPDPPAATLKQLQGKWALDRAIFKGKRQEVKAMFYTFKNAKVILQGGKDDTPETRAVTVSKDRPDVLEITPEKRKTTRWFFKIEKGELHLLQYSSRDPKGKPDFSGQTDTVMILRREKQ